jgi:4-amino-4-deoxy-L-arabinose transferase-like glycosyltransferase
LGRSWVDLAAAGAAVGFAVLTKSPGVFSLVFMGLWMLVVWLQEWGREGRLALWRKLILPGVVVMLVSFLTIFLLWPAMWRQPFETLQYIFFEAIYYAEQGHDGSNFFLGTIYTDGQIDWSVPHYYLVTYLWRSTPMVLLGLVLLLVAWPRRAALLEDVRVRQVVIALLVYAFFFWAFMNFGTKKFDRYGLPAHMALFLLSGLGWSVIAVWFQDLGGRFLQIQGPTWMLLLVIGAQMFTIHQHHPYYFTYFNPLMGGAKRAPQVMLVGWGEGLELAAEYLNQKPNAEEFLVMSPISYGSTSFYLKGESVPTFRIVGERLNPRKQEIVSEVDYVITYVNNWQRILPEDNLYMGIEPEHTIWLNGLEYVRIYPRESLPFLDQVALGE